MPTAAENRNPPATAANEIGAGQPARIEIISENTTPMIIPAIPPVTLKITDSARNCSRTCVLRAPIAIRRPISLVRSVTDTSKMFMMPMPPTISDIDATAASRERHDTAAALGGLRNLAQVADGEIIGIARPDAVPAHQDVRDLADRGLNLLASVA